MESLREVTVDKISPEVSRLIRTAPAETPVRFNILLRHGSGSESLQHLVRDMDGGATKFAADVRLVPSAGMVLCTLPLGAVEQVSHLPDVVWIDAESRAPIEDLLDG